MKHLQKTNIYVLSFFLEGKKSFVRKKDQEELNWLFLSDNNWNESEGRNRKKRKKIVLNANGKYKWKD